ncbi:MAG TPA: PspC domain-containing protein [Candidatus Bacteroides merdigallinarum]|uniref:PspC domain-containing protein n=1 Tax=Candidatus Bacteroides merdigallinarum TaxID=2838473 RepID=A0A9D2J2I0_9BACE|nr:PspC domain-containing protein [Candidatus Bacteroides merdigallinarum]
MDNPKRLTRPRQDRKMAGVCAGLANYLGLDPTVVRVIYAILSLCTAIVTGLIVYLILMLVIPEDPTK